MEKDVCFEDVPVSPALKVLRKHRDITEELPEDELLDWSECQRLVIQKDLGPLLEIPEVKKDIDFRQFETVSVVTQFGAYSTVVDVSAFNTMDFHRSSSMNFDKYRYFTDKAAERARDLAIMHSAITDEKGKSEVKQKFTAFLNSKYRNYALKLLAMYQATEDDTKKAELLMKIEKQNKQIRSLNRIWEKFAYVE